jgi:hypothetical protein
MTTLRILSATIALVILFGTAHAGQIWTDQNGDGLPDGGDLVLVAPSTNVTVGVWIDAQSFAWTNFLAYIEWSGLCISYVSASYVISGGSNFPIDDFSHPRGVGFGGSGYSQGGIDHIGNVTLHISSPLGCCVTPIIDVYNPYYVFSQLGAGSAYMIFSTNPGSCYNDDGGGGQGACCFADCSCQILTESECVAAGGVWNGEGSDCSSCPDCPPFEACCFPDGSCVDALTGNCPAGSVPQGAGTSCATVICPAPTGGCCFPDFSCVILTSSECAAVGGMYLGDGTDCSLCDEGVFEACCFPDGSCVVGPFGECPAGSTPQGANTRCEDVLCSTTPVESRSWGEVKGLFR